MSHSGVVGVEGVEEAQQTCINWEATSVLHFDPFKLKQTSLFLKWI